MRNRFWLAGLVLVAACAELPDDPVLGSEFLAKPAGGGVVIHHPDNGAKVKARRFTYAAHLPLSPDGRATVITMTIRDKETGDELSSGSIVVNGPAGDDQSSKPLVRHPKDGASVNGDTTSYTAQVSDLPPGRLVTLTLTIRDQETGDEVATSTIEVEPV